MDFSLSDEQAELRAAVIEFARRLDKEQRHSNGPDGGFSEESWKRCAEFGIQGLPMPEEFGGSDRDPLTCLIAMEALGYGYRDNGIIFGINAQLWTVQAPLLEFGSSAQKASYLPRLIGGEMIGAHAITEPGSGSDAFAMTTRAEPKEGAYLLNGSKTFVSNAPVADLFLIFAVTDPRQGFMGISAFLVEKDTPGLSIGKPISKMGLHSSPMAELHFDDVAVSEEQRLGKEGNGAAIFNYSMIWERSSILASCVGTMERQLEACLEYARERRQFGQPIGRFQSVANKIVDMKVRLESARLLLYKAGWLRSHGRKAALEVALAKLQVAESFVQSSLDAIQIHGGYGYCSEYGFEGELRDAVGARIYSGTSEIQRNLIARELGL